MPNQQQLIELYETFFAKATLQSSLAMRLSCPLLLHIGPHWEHATRRLLIVGQETLSDWCFAPGCRYPWNHAPLHQLDAFLNQQQLIVPIVGVYEYEIHQIRAPAPRGIPQGGTPFWDANKFLADIPDSAWLWSNLVRSALKTATPSIVRAVRNGYLTREEHDEILQFQKGLLAREIQLLDPTAVVFLTGPTYDYILLKEFSNASLGIVNNYEKNYCASIIGTGLPKRTYRVYHPTYLRRSRKWHILSEIRELTC